LGPVHGILVSDAGHARFGETFGSRLGSHFGDGTRGDRSVGIFSGLNAFWCKLCEKVCQQLPIREPMCSRQMPFAVR
jgi:hypothetical protein